MPKKQKKVSSKITRLRAQTKAIRVVNGLILCLFGLSAGLVAVATALPQKRKLGEAEEKYLVVLENEARVVAEKEDRQAEYEALREDREFLEIHAKDRLNLHRLGEKIYRVVREN